MRSYNYMRKRRRSVLSVMLAVIFLISSMPVCAVPVFADGETGAAAWDGSTADTAWYTGHESDDSYKIRTGAELAGLAKLVNDGAAFEGKTVSLAGDIDLAGDAASGKNRWTPIGQDFQHQFKGTFDGKGYTVSGLYVDSTASFSGFFGLISGRAEIKDLTVSGTVKSTQMNTGGILGGALSGTEDGTAAVVSGCVNNCNVESGDSRAGGIAGYGWNLTIADCINNGNITYTGTAGTTGVGGVIGQMAGGADVVESCVNTGTISAASGSARLGGVIGSIVGGDEMIVRNCYNTGSVSNVGIAGGIAADAGSTGTTMKLFTSCYNRGTITGAEGQTGGIAGKANDAVRGLLANSYYLTGSAPGGIGGTEDGAGTAVKTAEQLKALASTLGAAYKSDYTTPINDGYPILAWQTGEGSTTNPDPGPDPNPPITVEPFITIKTQPAKSVYTAGETFDPAGLVLTYTKSDGSTEDITEGYTVSPDGALTADDTVITITYKELTATVSITVNPAQGTETPGAWDGTSSDQSWYTAGLTSYTISNPAQLKGFAELVTAGTDFQGKTVSLLNDLDLGGHEWTPIGVQNTSATDAKLFGGTFEGNYHTISNFKIEGSSTIKYAGLFSTVKDGGVVRDLGISRADISAYDSAISGTGAIAGYIYAKSAASAGVLIENCWTTASVKLSSGGSNAYIGGIVGRTSSYATNKIAGCINNALIFGGAKSGGMTAGSSCTVENCYNAGIIGVGNGTGNAWAGGLGGFISTSASNFKNSYNVGSVIQLNTSKAVSAAALAYCSGGGTFTNCYYLTGTASGYGTGKASADKDSAGVSAKTGAELQNIASELNASQKVVYKGTETDVWTAPSGSQNNGYPILYWQKDTPSSISAVTDVEITKAPSKTTYGEGQKFDPTGMEITVKYADGSSILTPAYTQTPSANTPLTSGDSSIDISVCGKTVKQPITVLTAKELRIKTPPTQTEYILNDSSKGRLKTAGMAVELVYSDGSSAEIASDTYTISPAENTMLTKEDTALTVTYGELSAATPIHVKAPVSVKITDAPTSAPGFKFHAGDKLSITGLKLLLTYDDGSTEVVSSGITPTPANYTVLTEDMDKLTVSYTKAGVTMTGETSIEVIGIQSLEITTPPTKTEYKEGTSFSKSGMAGKVTYKDGTSKNLTYSDFTVKGSSYVSSKNPVITLTYAGAEVQQPITVIAATSMTVTKPTKTSFREGDKLSGSPTVKLTFDDGTTQNIYASSYTMTPSTTDLLTSSDKKVTVTYGDFEESWDIDVTPATGMKITVAPTKTEYEAGELFDCGSMSVQLTYETENALTLYTTDVKRLNIKPGLDTPLEAGMTEVVFSIGNVSVSQPIIVNAPYVPDPVVTGIEITTAPTKTSYYAGDKFDAAGMAVTAKYDNGTTKVLEASEYTVAPAQTEVLTADVTEVTVTYGEFTAKQAITVTPVVVTEIEITTAPTKTSYYAGDKFDAAGMAVTAKYNNGTTKMLEASEYTVAPAQTEALTADVTEVTVTYGAFTAKQAITVTPVIVTEIEITTAPTKTSYYVGDKFDAAGMAVTAKYNNGTTAQVTDYTADAPESFTEEGTKTVTVTYEGKTATFDVTVAKKSSSGGGSGGGGTTQPTAYQINIPSSTEGGSVSVSPVKAAKGSTVTVTVKPDEGYELQSLSISDKSGTKIDSTEKGNGSYTFTMPASAVDIKAVFRSEQQGQPGTQVSPFRDVADGSWYYDAVMYVSGKKLMNGTASDIFEPSSDVTRAMLAQILYNMEGKPATAGKSSFNDVSDQAWYADAVAWAASKGIVKGIGENRFAPERTITRQEMAVMIRRYEEAVNTMTDISGAADVNFIDSAQIASWAAEGVDYCAKAGLLNGKTGGAFDPEGTTKRCELAALIQRMCEKNNL